MLQAVRAVVKQGRVVLLEDYPLKEGAEYLLVALNTTVDDLEESLRQRREEAVRWYDEYRAQAATAAPAMTALTDAEVVQMVHDSRH